MTLLGYWCQCVGEEVGDEDDDGSLAWSICVGLEVGASVRDSFGLDVGDPVGFVVGEFPVGGEVGDEDGAMLEDLLGLEVGVDVSTVTSSSPNVPPSTVVP